MQGGVATTFTLIGQSKAAKPVLDTIIGNEVILMWVTEDGTLHTVALPEPRFVLGHLAQESLRSISRARRKHLVELVDDFLDAEYEAEFTWSSDDDCNQFRANYAGSVGGWQ